MINKLLMSHHRSDVSFKRIGCLQLGRGFRQSETRGQRSSVMLLPNCSLMASSAESNKDVHLMLRDIG